MLLLNLKHFRYVMYKHKLYLHIDSSPRQPFVFKNFITNRTVFFFCILLKFALFKFAKGLIISYDLVWVPSVGFLKRDNKVQRIFLITKVSQLNFILPRNKYNILYVNQLLLKLWIVRVWTWKCFLHKNYEILKTIYWLLE